jgi:threonyl-tRNA synthetase
MNENYKLELLDEIPREETITIYTIGNFVDLCSGPHLPSTGYVKYFKLLSIAGAYWQGDERNPMLQRIYGVSFPKKSKLEEHMKLLHEAEKRDHRKLGKELDLFHFDKDVGPGLVLWTPRGAAIREIIENTWKNEHRKHGYEIIITPHIGKSNLWKTSGHLDFYIEDMYSPMDVDGQLYFLKPMNCPFHISLYKRKRYSYRDLPLRWTELGTVYRFERSGVLHGLTRVRGFTVDDAHIICRPDQILDEIIGVINFSFSLLRLFGFENFQIFLSTKPDKYVGSNENWEMAEKSLTSAINSTQFPYSIDEGAGVFYGPKIDIFLTDALQRSWQCTTIQFDFNLPERFDMTYIAKDGFQKRPYVIHRALFGSIERFFAILLEHYAGNFPVWLAPVQVAILPVSEKHVDYSQNVYKELFDDGFRVILDDSNERVGYKIRIAETKKIPYMMILGEKEEEKKIVSIRRHLDGDLGQMSLVNFKSKLRKEINSKK